MLHPEDPEPSFNLAFENQPIASVIYTQPIRYKRAESSLLANEKGPQQWIQVVIWIYIYIYRFIATIPSLYLIFAI